MTTKLTRGATTATPEQQANAALYAVGLLNGLESWLAGWTLAFDRDEIKEILDPIYTALDEGVPR